MDRSFPRNEKKRNNAQQVNYFVAREAGLRDVFGDCLNEFGDWEVTLSGSIQEGTDAPE